MISGMGLGSGSSGKKSKTSALAQLGKKYAGSNKENKLSDSILRTKIAKHDLNSRAFGLTLQRMGEEMKSGGPSATASISKYYGTEQNKSRYELMLEAMGTNALGWEGEPFSAEELAITRDWLRTKGNSIEGGTSEVQLNVISKGSLIFQINRKENIYVFITKRRTTIPQRYSKRILAKKCSYFSF